VYAYIKGILRQASPLFAIVETHGIGWKLLIPNQLHRNLPPLGEEILLYTSFVVREQSQALYAFLTMHERDLFETLLEITGIGPKTALSLISYLPYEELVQALLQGDIKILSRAQGIGRKTAERLVLEIKDKLSGYESSLSSISVNSSTQSTQEAISVLVNLGYTQYEAKKAIEKTLSSNKESLKLEDLIALTLKAF
jgi:Holliday junction DNA helicase RuvA